MRYSKKVVNAITDLLSSDNYTISEVCQQVGINPKTYYDWLKNKPEFAEVIDQAIDDRMKLFAKEAKRSLMKKLTGYTIQEKHTTYVEAGKNEERKPKIKEQKIVDKHFQPDTAAIIFTLTNAEPENWKNKYNGELTGKDGKDLFSALTDEELDKRIGELERKLGKNEQE
jgi:transposase-like protein